MNFRWLRLVPPWQNTRAILGSTFSAFLPVISAIFSATGAFPGSAQVYRDIRISHDVLRVAHAAGKPAGSAVGARQGLAHLLNLGVRLYDKARCNDGKRHAEDDAERGQDHEPEEHRLPGYFFECFHRPADTDQGHQFVGEDSHRLGEYLNQKSA